MFFDLFGAYLEGDAINSIKGCIHICYHKIQCITKIIQKPGYHASNLYFITLWVKGILNMNSLNLGEI